MNFKKLLLIYFKLTFAILFDISLNSTTNILYNDFSNNVFLYLVTDIFDILFNF